MVENYGQNVGESPPESAQNEPPAPAQQPVQPYPAQQYAAPPAPAPQKKNMFESMSLGSQIYTIIVVGILLMMLGMILIHAAPSVTNYGSATPSYEKMQDDQALENSMKMWGQILTDLGIAALSAFLIIGSMARKDTELKIRVGMFALAAILIILAWIWIAP